MEWYLYRNQQQYGPYAGEQLADMQKQGNLLQDDLFSKQGEAWISLEKARELFVPTSTAAVPISTPIETAQAAPLPQNLLQPQIQPQMQQQPIYPYTPAYGQQQGTYPVNQPKQKTKRKKHRFGCLTAFLLVFAVLFGSVYLFLNRDSSNLTLERQEKLATESIEVAGGTVDFTLDNGQATLTVPEGAYDKTSKFKVSTKAIKEHKLGEHFTPITPLITIDNKHAFSDETMLLTIPIQIADDEFAMAFYYDPKSGELEGMPLVSLSNDSITVATHHFSDFVVSKIKTESLKDLDIDTGFVPGYDDWQFPNFGSYIAPRGHCAGQSISAMWYYDAIHKGENERKLYGRYDNNYGNMGTIDFWEDDAQGYRFASTIQRKIGWDSTSIKALNAIGTLGDRFTFFAFSYSMLLTNNPQFVGVSRFNADGSRAGGHALVAYKIKGNELFIADPNYPGVAGRKISFNDGKSKLNPYSSAANKAELDAGKGRTYTGINYYATSSMVDYSLLASEYEKLLKNKVGDDLFTEYKIEILEHWDAETDVKTWKECPLNLELDLEDTAKVHEDLAGKVVLKYSCAYNNLYCQQFNGTKAITNPEITGDDASVVYVIPLTKGVNDIGLFVQTKDNGRFRYVDFKRINIIYETIDLTGTWQGEMVITEGGNIIDFIVRVFGDFMVAIAQAFDEDADAATIKAELRNNIEDQLIGQQIPMTIELSKVDPKDQVNYNAVVRYQAEEGELMEFKTKLKYKSGEIKFNLYDKPSASRFAYKCELGGNDVLSGEYAVHAWGGLVRNAFSGEWRVDKLEDTE